MQIEFYKEDTGEILKDTAGYFFIMDNEVYCDNGKTYESQCAVVSFDDFVARRQDIRWRIIA